MAQAQAVQAIETLETGFSLDDFNGVRARLEGFAHGDLTVAEGFDPRILRLGREGCSLFADGPRAGKMRGERLPAERELMAPAAVEACTFSGIRPRR